LKRLIILAGLALALAVPAGASAYNEGPDTGGCGPEVYHYVVRQNRPDYWNSTVYEWVTDNCGLKYGTPPP